MTDETKTVDQGLLNSIVVLKGLTLCHNLIQEGAFPHRMVKQIEAALEFTSTEHARMLDECLNHEDADLVPELVKAKGEAVEKQ